MTRHETRRDHDRTLDRGAVTLLATGLGFAVLGFVVAGATASGGVAAPMLIAGGGIAALGLLSGLDHGPDAGGPAEDHERGHQRLEDGRHRPVESPGRLPPRAATVDHHRALQTARWPSSFDPEAIQRPGYALLPGELEGEPRHIALQKQLEPDPQDRGERDEGQGDRETALHPLSPGGRQQPS